MTPLPRRLCWICETRPVALRNTGGRFRTYCIECDEAAHALALYWRQIGMPLAWDNRPHDLKPRATRIIGLCSVCNVRPGNRRANGCCWACYTRMQRQGLPDRTLQNYWPAWLAVHGAAR